MIWSVRTAFIVLAAMLAALGTQPAVPQKIAFARVFPNAGQIGLFIANADGSDEHPLIANRDVDYDPAWSPDGAWIVFTSDRGGSADLFRVQPDGTGLERLTDDPAYDDQAAFSPDGKQLVFVSTRGDGTADLWTMDLTTRRTRALTSGPGGDFRPSWSPDGNWIAFSSDRGSAAPFGHGRWEHLQLADLYMIRPDGSGLKRVSEHGAFCGSPKWISDSRHVVAYCMTAEQTLANRRPAPEPGNDTRLVSIDVASGMSVDVPTGPGVKMDPSPLPGNELGYVRKDTVDPGSGIYYASGRRGPRGDVRVASWSPDGKRVVYHKRLSAPIAPLRKTFSRSPEYELTLTGTFLPSFSPAGDRFVTNSRPSPDPVGASLFVTTTDGERSDVIYQDKTRNVLAPQWSPRGDTIIFSVGTFNAFFNGFHGLFLKPEDRIEGGAQVALINPDGTGFREVTSGQANNAFPSLAPDGNRFVFRTFGPDGGGLRIMDLTTKAVTTLTRDYDNFPLWSPRGDLIVFSRQAEGAYEIYTIKPDGTAPKRLTFTHGNDAHMAWSPDGEYIAFVSSRMGFKDEVAYTDAPQPYGEMFVTRYDGTRVQQLTDNQWEEGAPAWQPNGAIRASGR
jgi:TolB protein